MTLQDVVTHIIVVQLDVSPSQVRPEFRLREDFDCDSLDLAEIVMDLEDDFGFEIVDARVLTTVKDCMEAVDAGATLRPWEEVADVG